MSKRIAEIDLETIRSFQWIEADLGGPPAVDVDDVASLREAARWAWSYEYDLMPVSDEIGIADRDAVWRYRLALEGRIHDLVERDRAALAAWTEGRPIAAEVAS